MSSIPEIFLSILTSSFGDFMKVFASEGPEVGDTKIVHGNSSGCNARRLPQYGSLWFVSGPNRMKHLRIGIDR